MKPIKRGRELLDKEGERKLFILVLLIALEYLPQPAKGALIQDFPLAKSFRLFVPLFHLCIRLVYLTLDFSPRDSRVGLPYPSLNKLIEVSFAPQA